MVMLLMAARADCADPDPFYTNKFEKVPSAAALAQLGRLLFLDTQLSASGKMACAGCHDPKNDFAQANDLAVQRGGGDGRRPGLRAVPSLMYAQNVPPFTEHYVDDDGDDSIDQGPAGGRTWDGRAQSAHEQAVLPLLSPFEMANANAESVVKKVQHSAYAAKVRAALGGKIFDEPSAAFKGILLALETYQQTPAEFYPYTSKYDAFLRGEVELDAQEARGLRVFNDPSKGNCARCHPSQMRRGAFPQFTDFGFAAIGVPRNARVPANADPRFFDLGLCGPLRKDLVDKTQYCGFFRTPTLRNVARRRVFFHNGVIHSLEKAVRFYAERDSSPANWYPAAAGGAAEKFDDLPSQFRDTVDTLTPFDRPLGQAAALSAADIADVVAFLRTLSDGYEVRAK